MGEVQNRWLFGRCWGGWHSHLLLKNRPRRLRLRGRQQGYGGCAFGGLHPFLRVALPHSQIGCLRVVSMSLSGYWEVSAYKASGRALIPLMIDLDRVLSLRDEKPDVN